MIPSPDCLALIHQFEGCAKSIGGGRFAAYPDPASGGDPWTIGWGSTGSGITKGTVWTQAQCDERLQHDVTLFSAQVLAALKGASTSQHQFDALVDFAYNEGVGHLRGSTLLRLHVAGNFAAAQLEFAKWNKAAGKVMLGLVKRRAAEAALYGRNS